VLGFDGLTLECADSTWTSARMHCLTSTFPSTSVTAWTTALTGAEPSEHLGMGMVYRIPRLNRVAHVVANRPVGFQSAYEDDGPPPWSDDEVISPQTTVFECARARGIRCVVLGREMDRIPGPWTATLFRGAERAVLNAEQKGTYHGNITDAAGFADALVAEIDAVSASRCSADRLLLWAYVNLDDHIHLQGYDLTIKHVLIALESAARRWAALGWTVLAHSDHGQTPCNPDAQLVAAWRGVDSPSYCRLPSGGAGRVRWLYPRPGMQGRIIDLLSDRLGDHAVIATADEIAEKGLWRLTPSVRERVGEVVAIAMSHKFPVPRPDVRYDHGGLSEAEMLVPVATWSQEDM
jgi:Type I phosphodiesterase / nucleotide pyrophosphatase